MEHESSKVCKPIHAALVDDEKPEVGTEMKSHGISAEDI